MAFKGVEHELKLTEDELLVLRANVNTQQGSTAKISAKNRTIFAAHVVSIDEMYGATRDLKDPRSFHVHVLVAVTDKKREQRSLSFTCGTTEQAGTWIDVLQHTIIGVPLTGLRLWC